MKTMVLMVIFAEQSGQSEGGVPADGLQVPLQRAEQGRQQQDHSQAPQDTQDLERFFRKYSAQRGYFCDI